MAVSRATLDRMAQLARLRLTGSEAERFRGELSAILEAIDLLRAVRGDAPGGATERPLKDLRPDKPREASEADAILADVPHRTGRSVSVKGGVLTS